MPSELDKLIIRELQNGLPLVSRPFLQLAIKLDLTENMLIGKINDMIKEGLIRRFGASLRHQDLGFTSNAMIVWDVPNERVIEVGKVMASFKEVTHCYQRPRRPGWPYNLFTVVHGGNRDDCTSIAVRLAQKTRVKSYQLIFSTAELKKISMCYFKESFK